MKLPLILIEYGAVQIYESVSSLLQNIESPDIDAITVFDSSGNVVPLFVKIEEKNKASFRDRWYSRWIKSVPIQPVYLDEPSISENRVEELEEILREFLIEHGMADRLAESISISDLIELVRESNKKS